MLTPGIGVIYSGPTFSDLFQPEKFAALANLGLLFPVFLIGINMVVGYGLTESLATVSCDHSDKKRSLGSVGRPI